MPRWVKVLMVGSVIAGQALLGFWALAAVVLMFGQEVFSLAPADARIFALVLPFAAALAYGPAIAMALVNRLPHRPQPGRVLAEQRLDLRSPLRRRLGS